MKNLIEQVPNKKWIAEYDLFTTIELNAIDNIDDIVVIENGEIKSKNGDKILLFMDSFIHNSTYLIDIFDLWVGELSDTDWNEIRKNDLKFYICNDFQSKVKIHNKQKEFDDYCRKNTNTIESAKIEFEKDSLPPIICYFNNDNTISKAGFIKESYIGLLTKSDFHDIFHCMFK